MAKSFVAVMLCATAAIGQAQTWRTNGLVAYYPMDGNAKDATGNGYDGEVHGAQLVQDRFGNPNSAFSFNGTNSFIFLTNTVPLSDTWTVSAWARLSDLGQQGYIFHLGTDNGTAGDVTNLFAPGGNGFGALYLNNGYVFDAVSGSCWMIAVAPPPDTNTWFQVAIVRNKDSQRIILNGVDYSSIYGWTCTNAVPIQGFIGAGSTHGLFFAGDVDELRVYNRALSDDEVQQLYAYESGQWSGTTPPLSPSFPNLAVNSSYQLQMSADMKTWTNQGLDFAATNSTMTLPQYFDIAKWGALFFRLQKLQ